MNTRSTRKVKTDCIVIGGGAAGLFAAGVAAHSGVRVLLLEKNEKLGKKLYITGKGRCNVTNNTPYHEVLKNVPRNPRFLSACMSVFPPAKAMAFFERQGVPLKVERGDRVFPVSDHASDITAALTRYCQSGEVEQYRGEAVEILTENGAVCGVRLKDGTELLADRVILATGGCSYPLTGSDGSGYRLAAALGHSIVPPVGSLVPLEEEGNWCARLQGLSLRNVAIRLKDERGKRVYSDFGELLFTHFGVSGPTVLSASAHMKEEHQYQLTIDLKPALDEGTLDARILRDFQKYINKNLANALVDLYPRSLIPVMLERAELHPDQKVNTVTKAQRHRLMDLTKAFPVRIRGKRPVEEAIVTSGGVSVKEIETRSMESRLIEGLHFAGEVIDVDAYTGGFNLQIAWATGWAAGRAVAGLPLKDESEEETE